MPSCIVHVAWMNDGLTTSGLLRRTHLVTATIVFVCWTGESSAAKLGVELLATRERAVSRAESAVASNCSTSREGGLGNPPTSDRVVDRSE